MDKDKEQLLKEQLEHVRAALQGDGGDCELVAVEGDTVKLRLKGACGGCPMAMMTLKGYVEAFLKDKVDEKIVVERVE